MHVNTSRFGGIEIGEEDVITFPEGIIGFSDCKRYSLVVPEDGAPLKWLQSLERPDLAFVVIDPLSFIPEYSVEVSREEINMLQLNDISEARVLCIVVVTLDNIKDTRTNLRGPLVINPKTRIARQLVLSDKYPLRHILFHEGSGNACSQAQAR